MALTRKFLSAMGIEADKVDEIIAAHVEVTDALKAERDGYKATADKLAGVQKELDELKAAAEKDGKDPFKVKYDALKEEFDSYKKGVTEKETKRTKTDAYRDLLKRAGVADKRIDAVLKVSDIDKIELDKDGKIKDEETHLKSIKEEWSDFVTTPASAGAKVSNPPSGSGKTYKSKEEIYAIKDTGERQKAIAENHELFGF